MVDLPFRRFVLPEPGRKLRVLSGELLLAGPEILHQISECTAHAGDLAFAFGTRQHRQDIPFLDALGGCPHLIFAVPTLLNREARFRGPEGGDAAPPLVRVAVELETGGHFLTYYLRVDGTNLTPSAGPCRRCTGFRG